MSLNNYLNHHEHSAATSWTRSSVIAEGPHHLVNCCKAVRKKITKGLQ